MVRSIGGQGHLGLAFETAAAGTYAAPTKWAPIMNESLVLNQASEERRVIRGIADSAGTVIGNSDVSGEINMEVLSDALPYFLYAGRYNVVKTGVGPYTYTATGAHIAEANTGRTLSLQAIRNGVPFSYVGCIVGGLEFTVDNGKLMVKVTIVGMDESTETLGVPAYTNQTPFGAGMYQTDVDAGTVTDIDTFTLGINDNAIPAHRLKNTTAAEFIHWGERNLSASFARDFQNRTDYDGFRALTAQNLDILATKAAGDQVLFEFPVMTKNTYELPLSAQGDLVRAAIDFHGDYDATVTAGVRIVVDTPTENIT